MLQLCRFVAVMTLGLAAGIIFSHVLQMPQKALLSAESFLEVQQVLLEGYGSALVTVEALAFLSAAGTLVLKRDEMGTTALLALTVVCVAAMIVVRVALIAPLNEQIAAWTPQQMPANWEQFRDQWSMLHTVRFGLAMLGFGTYILSLIDPLSEQTDVR